MDEEALVRCEQEELRARTRVMRDEAAFRGLMSKTYESDLAVRFHPTLPEQRRSESPSEFSRAESVASTSSMSLTSSASFSSTASFTHSAVYNAIVAADSSELDTVLETLRLRHAKHAKRLGQYNRVRGRGQQTAELLVTEQQHEEGRGDIVLVEDAWRDKIAKEEAMEPWRARLVLASIEDDRRTSIMEHQAELVKSLVEESFEELWDLQEAAVADPVAPGTPRWRRPHAGPSDEPVSTLKQLLAKAVTRAEATARYNVDVAERHARQELYRLWPVLVEPTTHLATTPHRRAFDAFQCLPTTEQRLSTVRRHLLVRKAALREHETTARGVEEEELAARRALVYHYDNVICFQVKLPTSVAR
jgi:hypothetical protein